MQFVADVDPQSVVISVVLGVHFLGVFLISAAIALLLLSLCVVVIAVHGARSALARSRKLAKPLSEQNSSKARNRRAI